MKQIQPIQIWQNGQNRTATYISLTLVYDDLQNIAVFSYRLCDRLETEEDTIIHEISTGAVSIEGQEYQDWGTTLLMNEEAYILACQKLNLYLI